MAPKKLSALKAIRRQVAAEHRLKASALAGSGYANILIRNARRDGMPLPRLDNEKRQVTQTPLRGKITKITKKVPRRPLKRAPSPEPQEPEIECWNRAGGGIFPYQRIEGQGQPGLSSTLGIARIASWRREPFVEQLRTLVEQHAELDEIVATEIDHGGEMMLDVYVRFRSELVAEATKEKIDGEVLGGRMLSVNYA